jgi:hypothetical protein
MIDRPRVTEPAGDLTDAELLEDAARRAGLLKKPDHAWYRPPLDPAAEADRRHDPNLAWRAIAARHRGTCMECGIVHLPKQTIYWLKGTGVRCIACQQEAAED